MKYCTGKKQVQVSLHATARKKAQCQYWIFRIVPFNSKGRIFTTRTCLWGQSIPLIASVSHQLSWSNFVLHVNPHCWIVILCGWSCYSSLSKLLVKPGSY
jgi:uncharacterized membrane protein